MDFELPTEATDAADLAATICADHCTPERLAALDGAEDRFDPLLWRALGDAGLLGLAIPEEHGGAGLGIVEQCAVTEQLGRSLAAAPLEGHAAAAMLIAEFGPEDLRRTWLPRAASGDAVLTCALFPAGSTDGAGEAASVVPAGPVADLVVLPVREGDRVRLLAVPTDAPGLTCEPQPLNDGDRAGRITLSPAAREAAVEIGADEEWAWLEDRLRVLGCARQLGVVDGALALTSAYARTREQFGRPIGTFQAVSQRLADGYIDVLGARLTLWQAAWRIGAGLPATAEVAEAALWAADAGHRVAHTTVHVHGGVGIDLDGEAHRFFTAAKRGEFLLGGATAQARTIGRLLAESA